MQVVCEATQNPSVAVQVGAFECLVRIMSLYYDKMALYMEQALFGVCINALCSYCVFNMNLFLPVDCSGNEASRRTCGSASH